MKVGIRFLLRLAVIVGVGGCRCPAPKAPNSDHIVDGFVVRLRVDDAPILSRSHCDPEDNLRVLPVVAEMLPNLPSFAKVSRILIYTSDQDDVRIGKKVAEKPGTMAIYASSILFNDGHMTKRYCIVAVKSEDMLLRLERRH